MSMFPFQVLTLKIKLKAGTLRKVTIPDFYTFGHLHKLMVFLFEWDDDHLHKFELPKPVTYADFDLDPNNPQDCILFNMMKTQKHYIWVSNELSFLGMHNDHKEQNEDDTTLSIGFKSIGDKIHYEYDFGSSWHVDIEAINIESKTVKKSEFVPSIQIVGGRGKTIPEYGGPSAGGTKYNKKKLNEDIAKHKEFVYYPYDVSAANNHNRNESEEESENQDEDLHVNRNKNKKTKPSVLGKRKRVNTNKTNSNKKQRSQ
eukprot:93828_1